MEKILTNSLQSLNENEEKEIEKCLLELQKFDDIPPLEERVEILKKENNEEIKLELKLLPSHLKYVFLDEGGHKPVIISNELTKTEEEKLIDVLKKNQDAMG